MEEERRRQSFYKFTADRRHISFSSAGLATATAQALSVDEILQNIIKSFLPPSYYDTTILGPAENRALYALMRTSTTLFYAAAPALWSRLRHTDLLLAILHKGAQPRRVYDWPAASSPEGQR
ncbi:hypothetical protein OH77DRAFT_1432491 [Trametes cingulata]|nr:hypothetical protein OH77DRAFT_1432491 [Trametes cingulata]